MVQLAEATSRHLPSLILYTIPHYVLVFRVNSDSFSMESLDFLVVASVLVVVLSKNNLNKKMCEYARYE